MRSSVGPWELTEMTTTRIFFFFFYLLWGCSHHPVLIGQPGSSGHRLRGKKNLCIFLLPEASMAVESALWVRAGFRTAEQEGFVYLPGWLGGGQGRAWGTPSALGLWAWPRLCALGLLFGELCFPTGRLRGNTAVLAWVSQRVFVLNKRNPPVTGWELLNLI